MQHKTIIKGALALILASIIVMVIAQVRSFHSQEQQESQLQGPNPAIAVDSTSTSGVSSDPRLHTININEKAQRIFDAANKQSGAAEKEARQLFKERRFAQAEKACYRAISLSPKFNGTPMAATTFWLLGDIYREQRHYKDAIDFYFKAREHTRDVRIDLGIALSYLKLGDMKNARKFYDEQKFFRSNMELPATQKAPFMAQLPGTKTARTMEASILFARGSEKDSHAAHDEALEDFKKALVLVPRNALIASSCGSALRTLGRRPEAATYWARAAVFGRGYIATQAKIDLHNNLMPDKAAQALRDAKRIR